MGEIFFAKLALKGVSLMAASGDYGTYNHSCTASACTLRTVWPAASPWVTAVGGTQLVNDTAGVRQEAWNGSGGGFSEYSARISLLGRSVRSPRTSPNCHRCQEPLRAALFTLLASEFQMSHPLPWTWRPVSSPTSATIAAPRMAVEATVPRMPARLLLASCRYSMRLACRRSCPRWASSTLSCTRMLTPSQILPKAAIRTWATCMAFLQLKVGMPRRAWVRQILRNSAPQHLEASHQVREPAHDWLRFICFSIIAIVSTHVAAS